jgi:hypothetical protein
MNSRLAEACQTNNYEYLKRELANNPPQNINALIDLGAQSYGLLHIACHFGHTKIVSLLLDAPGIDVNVRSKTSSTPLMVACFRNNHEVVKVLACDPRVKINMSETSGSTPLYWAAQKGNIESVKRLIVCGKFLEIGDAAHPFRDAIGVARHEGKFQVAHLLERFRDHPEQIRHELMDELGVYAETAARMLANELFYSSGEARRTLSNGK